MAARRTTKRDAEVDVDTSADDLEGSAEAAELLDDDVDPEDDAFAEELDDGDDALDDAGELDESDQIEETGLEDADLDGEDGEDGSAVAAPLPPEAEFDDDELVVAVTGDDDSDDDTAEIDGLRDGEFVCRSCFMAKRETQLADPERLLCRDCA